MRKSAFFTAARLFGLAVLAALTLFVALRWKTAPQEVATHFNALGVADAFGDKSSLIMPLALAWILYGLVSFVGFLVGAVLDAPEVGAKTRWAMKLMLVLLGDLLVLVFGYIIVCIMLSLNLGAWLVPAFLAAAFVVMVVCIGTALKK